MSGLMRTYVTAAPLNAPTSSRRDHRRETATGMGM